MYQKWLAMEQFYYHDLWIRVILSCIAAVILFASISYYKKRIVQFYIFISILLIGYTVVFARNGYQQYGEMIETSFLTNPGTRDYQKKIFNDFAYGSVERSFYRSSYLYNSYHRLPMYNENELQQSNVTYRGTDGQYYYFEYDNGIIYYVGNRFVEFLSTDETYRIGAYFTLTDSQFEQIGFVPESRKYFRYYAVPEKMKGLTIDDEIKPKAIYQSRDNISGWLTP